MLRSYKNPLLNSKSDQQRGFGAFSRNRTDDLILTMDALYLLSYEGLHIGAGEGNRTPVVSLGS